MFEQIIAESTALQQQVDALRKEHAAKVKPLLQAFIKSNPQVAEVRWSQYTPYFNDGDECVFRVNDPYFKFVGDESDEGYDTWSMCHETYGPTPGTVSVETKASCEKLAEALNAIEDALNELFGDHVEVVVTPDGVEVEEYSHD